MAAQQQYAAMKAELDASRLARRRILGRCIAHLNPNANCLCGHCESAAVFRELDARTAAIATATRETNK